MAELHFCNVCDASVPLADIESGAAQRAGDRCICPGCLELLESPTGTSGPLGLVGTVIALMAVMAAVWVWWDHSKKQDAFRLEMQSAFSDQRDGYEGKLVAKLDEIRQELDQESRLTSTQLAQISDRLALLGQDAEKQFEELRTQTDQFAQFALEIESLGKRIGQAEASLQVLGERQREQRGSQETMRDQLDLLSVQMREMAERGPADGGAGEEAFQPKITALLRQLQSDDQDDRLDALEKLSGQNDDRLVPHLIPLLTDPYEFNRFYAAKTMGDWRAKTSVPHLIESLLDEISFVRQAAAQSLRQITAQKFGYDYQAEEADRQKAYESWKTWWTTNGKTFLGS
ncbi:MAG: HEAT repeat domain-containing protein [Planctomycetes bacterium]|nr:HEAT repeat domain-containing protein [Planctomycetota bacterium]